jgi:pimeloyl-ACP methyl ester carboxylesterase
MNNISSVDFRSGYVVDPVLEPPETSLDFLDIQMTLPKPLNEIAARVIAVAKVILATIIDIIMLPFALAYLGVTQIAKIQFDPACPERDKIPILLLHGSGYNQTEWIIGRQFLKGDQFGSVFSLNYAGLLTNLPQNGIDDYAAGKVRDKILEIKELTGRNEVILIGHSMGGLIAGCYAEEYAEKDNITVKQIITIGSPWKGSPAIDFLEKFRILPKKLTQMKVESAFLKGLASKALESEKAGTRNYYCIGSTTDLMVPAPFSNLTEDPKRQYILDTLGHYGLIISPKVWGQVRTWLSSAE